MGARASALEGVAVTPFWLDRPTLVTGATGLVGSWVVEHLLEAGAEVVCLVRDRVPRCRLVSAGLTERVVVVHGDVRDQALLERVLGEHEVDSVIHLAAQTIVTIAARNPVSTFESNVAGTWALLEACRRSPTVRQVVVASSDKAYGEQETRACDEDAPLRAVHPYDVSKACADLLARSYAATWGVPVAVTRCGNFYGGGDLNWNRIVPGTIRSVLRGQRPVIRSDGTPVRDYFYVEDGAAAYLHLVERLAEDRDLAGQAFNFSTETPLSVLELVQRILAVTGSGLEPELQHGAKQELSFQALRAERARRLLGWRPRFALEEGLARTVAWYRGHFAERGGA